MQESRLPIAGIRHSAAASLLLALLGLLPIANAQAAPESRTGSSSAAQPKSDPPSVATPATSEAPDSTDEDASRSDAGKTADLANGSAAKQPASAIPIGTPPKPPHSEDQTPGPYVAPPETVIRGKERHLTLSAVAGVWLHGLNGSGASTKAGPVWGVSGRVDPYRWLGIRVTILRGNQPVAPDFGALGVANVQIEQPDFQIISWAIRLEPTWHVTPTFALWVGPGLAWARAIAPEPRVGDLKWVTADRACVYLEAQFGLGAQIELVRDWVMLDLDLSASSLGYQHGSAHEPIQAFTPDGYRMHVGGYPNFSHKAQGLLGVGIIL
jgi:hypothetical protein